MQTHYVIANFGGPRNLNEIAPFLHALLTDRDVVRTNLPSTIHYFLFRTIAKRRAKKIAIDYQSIGGKSPIYEDTESVVKQLLQKLDGPVTPFHRYIPATHKNFIEEISSSQADEIRVFPMFPQFTYATTGSCARWFQNQLPEEITNKMRWIKSYPAAPPFVQAHQEQIRSFLKENQLKEEEVVLLFSAHGIPQKFVREQDVYQTECMASFRSVMEAFPEALGRLSYQSKFGPDEWLKPYTIDVCEAIHKWDEGRKHVVFVPISFTSDHIETLFEIETEYMTVVRDHGSKAYRVPALTLNPLWIKAIVEIIDQGSVCNNRMLIRRS